MDVYHVDLYLNEYWKPLPWKIRVTKKKIVAKTKCMVTVSLITWSAVFGKTLTQSLNSLTREFWGTL